MLRYLKQLLLSEPCAILYLLKDRVANPTPLNKFFKNIRKYKKIFENFIFRGWGEDRDNFVHSKNSFKIEGTTSPLQSMCYFVPIKREGG